MQYCPFILQHDNRRSRLLIEYVNKKCITIGINFARAGLTPPLPSEIAHTRHPTDHRDNITVHAYRVCIYNRVFHGSVCLFLLLSLLLFYFIFYIIYLASIRCAHPPPYIRDGVPSSLIHLRPMWLKKNCHPPRFT